MKKCNKCSEIKSLANFFKDKNNKTDGHYSICKSCKQSATMKWRGENKELYNAQMREFRKKNYQKERLYRYDITPEQHTQMLLNQNGLCAICKQPPKGKRPLVVDHCHTTDKVRGLLCYGCNRAIAILDNKVLLEASLAYLKK